MSDSSSEIRPRKGGAGLAFVVALTQAAGTAIFVAGGATALGYVLLAVGGLLLANRFRSPDGTMVLVAAVTVAYLAAGYPRDLVFFAPVIAAVNGLRARRDGQVWVLGLISIIAWGLLAGASAGRVLTDLAMLAGVAIVVEMITAAYRALARADEEQKRTRDERRRRKATEERLLIASELHDVIGHHLSLINVRAAVGRHLLDRQPEEARSALDAIEQASAEALREVRSVLDVLYPADHTPPRAPTPRLEQLEEITGNAGLPVSTTVRGEPRPLPAEVDRAAYRIVQEALTNVRRHAGAGATAEVLVEYGPEDMLTVQIDDDGGTARRTVAPITGGGNGIAGMRERAAALGGTLSAQPRHGGGWRVRALLPSGTDAEAESEVEDAA